MMAADASWGKSLEMRLRDDEKGQTMMMKH
jgi:hypothetical protein